MDFEIECPYCGELVTLFVDPAGDDERTYTEDCPACGGTWLLHVREEEPGGFAVGVARQDA